MPNMMAALPNIIHLGFIGFLRQRPLLRVMHFGRKLLEWPL